MPYVLVSALVILVAGGGYLESFRLPLAAARLPRIVCVVLVILALVVLVEALIARRRSTRGQLAQGAGSGGRLLVEPFFQGVRLGPLLGFAAAILGSTVLMPVLGYFVVTPFFLLGSLLAFQACRWPTAVAIGILFPLFVYLVFVAFLNTSLPLGVYFE